MISRVCVMTLFFLCLESGEGLICSPFYSKPKSPVQENKPATDPFYSSKTEPPSKEDKSEHPGFIYRSEGTEANVDCVSTVQHHQWHQAYQNSTSKKQEAIGNIPLQIGLTKTHYSITVERFDNNTVIYCKNDASKAVLWFSFLNKEFVKKYFKTSIKLFENGTPQKNEELIILPYSERKVLSFSCEEYVKGINDTYVGVINTTSNMIKTYRTILAHPSFNKTHNGTILCCVYYNVSGTADEKWIVRHVAKKTLLIYDDSVQQGSSEGNEMTNTETETGWAGNQTTTIYITTAVVGLLILLVIIVTCKKRWRKKPISDSKVLYVDLDLLRNVRPDSISRPRPEEESPYAQIIGVLKPNQ